MTETDRIIEILGGPKSLGRQVRTSQTLAPAVRQGISFRAVLNLKRLYEIPDEFAQRIIAVSARTWARRRAEDRLSPVESDRLYRLARIIARTEEVFGTREKAGIWLREPNRALGMQTPLALLDTDEGTRRVEDVLIRIEHGVFS
ncbi:MAG TPA: antitoxin Xre/MbcA/ParS toxin-binding domain-containing protein [Blastocatellia bacterium]|nr:antitoxin Xre/MbcA/ParS toxin-binding domain-containing protein [Blastocatellia bacterium]